MDDRNSKPRKSVQTSKVSVKKWLIALAIFLLGIVSFIAFRFATFNGNDDVHYHANFALFVNDQRDEFKNFTFYEEVSACSNEAKDNPKTRVHMHDQNNGLVHVHAHGVTWGQFFHNLGYVLGDSLVKTDDGVYINGQNSARLTFVLNGQNIENAANRLIKSEDRLLINYGNNSTKTIQQHFDSVPSDAHKANTENDPAGCSGGVELTNWQRLKQAAGV